MKRSVPAVLTLLALVIQFAPQRADAGAGLCCICSSCAAPPSVCVLADTSTCDARCLSEGCTGSIVFGGPECTTLPACGAAAPAPVPAAGAGALAVMLGVLTGFGYIGFRRRRARVLPV